MPMRDLPELGIMPSTYTNLHYHIVFSTKHRRPLIMLQWRSRLHAYLGGILREIGGMPLEINGVADHVHILAGLRSTHCLADTVREIKKASSHWAKEDVGLSQFAWQSGYSGFTVSQGLLDTVRQYIRRQEEHHRVTTFREELISLLQEEGIEYDPRYLD